MHRATTAAFRAAILTATAALAALATPAAAQASAQMEDTAPRWVIVTQKDAPARCDDFERFYKVATFQPGQMLSVDAESGDWARIAYPPDLHALVPAADARRIDDKTIQLVIDSRLRAPSAVLGIAGSWHSLYAEPIKSGARLSVIGEELGSSGEIAAYRVTPPEPPLAPSKAYAYIKRDALRDATKSEIEAHLRTLAPDTPTESAAADIRTGLPAGVQRVTEDAPAAAPQNNPPAITDATPVEPTPSTPPTTTKTTTSPGTVSLIEPMVRPGDERPTPTPKTNTGPAPTTQPAQATSANRESVTQPAEPPVTSNSNEAFDITAHVEPREDVAPPQPTAIQPATPVSPRSPEPASIEDLEVSLTGVRKLDTESQDLALDELLAEFRRTLAHETAKGDADERVLAGLQRRVAWLELRTETRDQRLAIEHAMREFSDRDRQLSAQVQRWESDRAYVVVGRLTPSSVYDGKRLPLMYRVQSVDPLVGPRTIAYVRPGQGQDFTPRLGQIVGVVGQTSDDAALALRIVRPERIDALNATTFAAEPTTTD